MLRKEDVLYHSTCIHVYVSHAVLIFNHNYPTASSQTLETQQMVKNKFETS